MADQVVDKRLRDLQAVVDSVVLVAAAVQLLLRWEAVDEEDKRHVQRQ